MTNANYQCPLCQGALHLNNKTFRCSNNHCFDQAKEGYVNLLPVHFKHSLSPGDNKEMVQARRQFLAQGYYQPLADLITSLYQKYCNAKECNLLDAGCGEGYYTQQHKTDVNSVYGVDIAKNAIRLAAKSHKNCHFSVATLSKLPFEDSFFNWIYSIYAPILEQEFTRVLAPDSYLLTVTPAENHLWELKQLIYRQPKQHNTQKAPIEHLTLVHEQQLNYQMDFSNTEDATNLLAMTPFAFKATEEISQSLAKQKAFKCQADFLIRIYQKKA